MSATVSDDRPVAPSTIETDRASLTNRNNAGIVALAILAIVFGAARFVNLEADFPDGITRYGVLYTDEGWYCNAAINHELRGNWHLEGDFNPGVTLPVAQLIQLAAFSVFGMSLTVARTVSAACFLVFALAAFLLCRRLANRSTAGCALLVITTNYVTFAYSRLAIVEMTMLAAACLSLVFASSPRSDRQVRTICSGGVVLALAVLVKTTAIAALPAFVYLAAIRGRTHKGRAAYAAIAVVSVLACISLYNWAAWHAFPDDFASFRRINFDARTTFSPLDVLGNFSRALRLAPLVAPVLCFGTLLAVCFLLARRGPFRECRLVHVALLLAAGHLALLSMTTYQPPRYFLPLVLPMALLFGRSMVSIRELTQGRLALVLQGLALTYAVALDGTRIVRHLAQPKFTFITMTHDVQQIVRRDRGIYAPGTLIGNFANTVSLATAIPSINTVNGTRSIAWRIETYKPTHYLALGPEPEVAAVIDRYYHLQLLREWSVFHNYYGGKTVRLFRLTAR